MQTSFYSLSNILKGMGYKSQFSAHLSKKFVTSNNFHALIPLRQLNIQRAINRKLISDFIINKNIDQVIYIGSDGFAKYTLNPSIISGISGIFQAPPVFYTVDAQKTAEFLSKIIHKFVYTLFSGPLIVNKEDLLSRIQFFLQKDMFIDNIYYYPIAQHVVSSVFVNYKIPLEFLESITENLVDYSAYKGFDIHSVSIIEALNFRYNILNLVSSQDKENIRIFAQNADAKISDEIKQMSYKQGRQPNMDYYVEFKVETCKNKEFFLDSKMQYDPVKTLSMTRGHFSLATSINCDYLMKRFRGDIVGSAKQKNVSNSEFDIIKGYALESTKIINNKKLSIAEKFQKYEEIIKTMMFDSNVTCVVPSIIKTSPENVYYNTYLMQNVSEYAAFISFLEKEIILNDISSLLIPKKGQVVHVDIWKNFILKVIKNMPQNIRENMLENYHKFNLLESS